MLQLEEAVQRILAAVPPPVGERVQLNAAHGRFAVENVASRIDLPIFSNSSMDGYAVRAGDTQGASTEVPRILKLTGRVPAGSGFTGKVEFGQCVRVFTGSPLPEGADAVLMQEDTRIRNSVPDEVEVLDSVISGENVRRRGEDVTCGTLLVGAGARLTPGSVALLSAAGANGVVVGARPVVGVLATGSELREPGETLTAGQIYESNRAALAALIRGCGGEAKLWPLVRDDPVETRDALRAALANSDVLITSGGVSVGEMDFIKSALQESGGKLDFWKVAIKPGRPFVFGECQGKLVFGLPGNPVSAMVTFLLLVRPALLRWQGAAELDLPITFGIAVEELVNEGNRRHFMRVRVDGAGNVHSAGTQASHILSSLAASNGLVDLAPETAIRAGSTVRVLRWD